jgi:hypothetical protein
MSLTLLPPVGAGLESRHFIGRNDVFTIVTSVKRRRNARKGKTDVTVSAKGEASLSMERKAAAQG